MQIYSPFSRCSTTRGSCAGLVPVGPTKFKVFYSLKVCFFGCLVIFLVIWFSLYSVLWILAKLPARFHQEHFTVKKKIVLLFWSKKFTDPKLHIVATLKKRLNPCYECQTFKYFVENSPKTGFNSSLSILTTYNFL